MERNGTTRPGNAPRDVWYQCAGNLVPAYLQPVQLVPTQFPIPPIVVPQHLARNPADPRLLDETTSSQFRGLINNRGDCVALQSQYFARRHKNHDLSLDPEHRPDENFPADDPARQKMLVGQIFLAIRKKTGLLNGQAVRDDQGEPSLDPSGNILRQPDANTRRVDGMSDVKVEMLSWDILYAIKDAHEGSLYGAEWTWSHSFNYEHHATFKKRFDGVLEFLQVSKRAVCDLLEASWICRVTNAPGAELERKRKNKSGNEKKSEIYKEGKKRLQSQAPTDEDNDASDGEDPGGDPDKEPREARPRKCRRVGEAATPEGPSASIEARHLPDANLDDPTAIKAGRPQLSSEPWEVFGWAQPPIVPPLGGNLPGSEQGLSGPEVAPGYSGFGGSLQLDEEDDFGDLFADLPSQPCPRWPSY